MRNLYANFVEILDICKNFSKNLVDERGNMPHRGVVPRFSDLEFIALGLTAEKMSIDSKSLLFSYLQEYKTEMPDLISRRQFNDRRKFTANLCEQIRKNDYRTAPSFGYCATQDSYYYGYKLHAVCGIRGVIPTGSALSFESKRLETYLCSLCQSKEACGNAFLTDG